ncbi:MAG: thrombospondin type 3 repeat-containing protein [Polyangiales bacterium]
MSARILIVTLVLAGCGGKAGKTPVAPTWVGDADRDGVADAGDRCPDKAEDFDGYKDADGCSDGDNDGDGIPDVDDQCPSVKGDKGGAPDPSGCPGIAAARARLASSVPEDDEPEPPVIEVATPTPPTTPLTNVVVLPAGGDKDNDGVKDSVDRCPNLREDGTDGDGCPGKDADKDKIPNAKDQCPEAPEDWDTVKDDDGCPEAD